MFLSFLPKTLCSRLLVCVRPILTKMSDDTCCNCVHMCACVICQFAWVKVAAKWHWFGPSLNKKWIGFNNEALTQHPEKSERGRYFNSWWCPWAMVWYSLLFKYSSNKSGAFLACHANNDCWWATSETVLSSDGQLTIALALQSEKSA